MKPEINRKKLDPESEKWMEETGKKLVYELLVYHDLDDLFFEDPALALFKLEGIVDNDEYFSSVEKDWVITPEDFINIQKRILKKLESLNNDDEDEALMILFYAVSSFESLVNDYLFSELDFKNLSRSEIKSIFKLSFDAKLGWLLMFICGSRYTDNKNWSLLKRFIETRNFFIHYKPVTWEQRDEHSNLLNKKSLNSFLDAAYDCYLFLNEHHSDEYKNYYDRIKRIQESKPDLDKQVDN